MCSTTLFYHCKDDFYHSVRSGWNVSVFQRNFSRHKCSSQFVLPTSPLQRRSSFHFSHAHSLAHFVSLHLRLPSSSSFRVFFRNYLLLDLLYKTGFSIFNLFRLPSSCNKTRRKPYTNSCGSVIVIIFLKS